jgi:hypothetical protein
MNFFLWVMTVEMGSFDNVSDKLTVSIFTAKVTNTRPAPGSGEFCVLICTCYKGNKIGFREIGFGGVN